MIPDKDYNPTATIPSVTIVLILLNAVIFFGELFSPGGIENVVFTYGAIPVEMLSLSAGHFKNIISSIFLHGGAFMSLGTCSICGYSGIILRTGSAISDFFSII